MATLCTGRRLQGLGRVIADRIIRQLRAQAEWPIPALLVTAEPKLPREPDGDVRVLQKPVADTVLRAAMEQALAAGHLMQ